MQAQDLVRHQPPTPELDEGGRPAEAGGTSMLRSHLRRIRPVAPDIAWASNLAQDGQAPSNMTERTRYQPRHR